MKIGIGLIALLVCANSAMANDAVRIATNMCRNTVNAFVVNPASLPQILGRNALQTASQQTNGTGSYPQIRRLGQPQRFNIVNPHIDQDQVHGQLFHFYCLTTFAGATIQWDLKFSPKTRKLEYFAFQPASAAGTPQTPSNRQPAVPQNRQPTQPQTRPTQPEPNKPPPSKEEACRMFPGMC